MARVVQQRSNPPYLLVVFIFLFFIATVLAVLFYVKYDGVRKEKAQSESLLNQFANRSERRAPQIVAMLEASRRGPRRGSTVVGQLRSHIDRLTEAISGQPADPEDVLSRVDDLFGRMGGTKRALIHEIEARWTQAKNDEKQIAQLKKQLQQKDSLIKKLEGDVRSVTAGLTAEIERLKGEVKRLNDEAARRHAAYLDDVAAVEKRFEEQIKSLNKNITDKVADLQAAEMQIAALKQQISRLETTIKVMKGGGEEMQIRPDGEIMRVLPEAGICYINIGKKDRVRPGLTFAVYEKTGVSKDKPGKASIVVTDVTEDISRCRILRQDKDNPIDKGDIISNIAFDRVRTFKFLVVGSFDLYGTGKPDENGARIVKQLLEQFGGELTDKLGPVDTDFVVMGAEPARPAPPREDAQLSEWDNYERKMKVYQEYQNILREAQRLNIPILNTNRLLNLTGYLPERTLLR